VIGGFTRGEGGRAASFGALTVGTWEAGSLRYAGRVGSGFTEATLAEVVAALAPLRTRHSPFTGRQPPRGTTFVEPRLIARVEFREWTASGTLRAPVFKGLRDDVEVGAVVREG
jgi:bifunctional non-homologous end joining protein LigD